MNFFDSDGVSIAYLDSPPEEGHGEPILLIHGFGSNLDVNWVRPGWVETLKGAGRRVIALDNRGHGASTKLYEPADPRADDGDTLARHRRGSSGGRVHDGALGRLGLARAEAGIMAIERRAIGADGLGLGAHVDEDMRMVEGGQRTHAHEFLGADTNRGDAGLIVEMRDRVIGHGLKSAGSNARTIAGPCAMR